MHPLKLLASSATILTLSICASAQATTSTEQQAQRTIEEYKDLRRLCTISTSKEKQECFSELSAMTGQYQAAKKALGSENTVHNKLYVGLAESTN